VRWLELQARNFMELKQTLFGEMSCLKGMRKRQLRARKEVINCLRCKWKDLKKR